MRARLLRLGIKEAEELAKKAASPGLWQTMIRSGGEAARWGAKWIGKPIGIGIGLAGLTTISGKGIEYLRGSLGWQTPVQEAEDWLRIREKQFEQAKKEFDLYKQIQNYLRTQKDPDYNPTNEVLPFQPEWLVPPKTPSSPKPSGKGFDFSMLLPVAAVGLIVLALWKR